MHGTRDRAKKSETRAQRLVREATEYQIARADQEHYAELLRNAPPGSMPVPETVDDPHGQLGDKTKVLRALRHDPLAVLLQRGIIGHDLYNTGREWQKLHEWCEIGQVRAIDPTKETCDGGRLPEMLSERYSKAHQKLVEADRMLGIEGAMMMFLVLGEGRSFTGMAHGKSEQRGRLTRKFVTFLELLAIHWGFRTK